MPKKTNKKPSRQETRRRLTKIQICFAAFIELSETNLDNLQIQKVMKRANFSFNTFYVHFNDKSDLLKGVLDIVIQSWLTEFWKTNGHKKPSTQLSFAILNWIFEFKRNPELRKFMIYNYSHIMTHRILFASFQEKFEIGFLSVYEDPNISLLKESQILGLLTAEASLICSIEANDEISKITLESVLNVLKLPDDEVNEALKLELPETPSLKEVMKTTLDKAIQDSIFRP